MYSNYICNYAWFSSQSFDKSKIIHLIQKYNSSVVIEENYMTENFSDTYFSRSDCSKIGLIREDIELLYTEKKLMHGKRLCLLCHSFTQWIRLPTPVGIMMHIGKA